MKLIDFHVHPGYDFHEKERGYKITPEIFTEGMKKSGIEQFAGSVIHEADSSRPIEEFGEITRRLNREAMEFYRLYPDMYIPGIHVHPDFVELSIEELEKHAAGGFKLVGELVPYLMKWSSYSQKGFLEIMKVAEELDMVVNIHPVNVPSIFEFAENCKRLKIVVAHLDSYGEYNSHIELMKRYENVYFDISAHGVDRAGMLRQTLDIVGKERILLGSDYPGYSPDPFINVVMDSSLSDEEKEAIAYKNAERLLGL